MPQVNDTTILSGLYVDKRRNNVMAGNIDPATSDYDLGRTTNKWGEIHVVDLYADNISSSGGAIGATISGTAPTLTFEDTTVGDDDWRIRVDADTMTFQQNVADASWESKITFDGPTGIGFHQAAEINTSAGDLGLYAAAGLYLRTTDDTITLYGTTTGVDVLNFDNDLRTVISGGGSIASHGRIHLHGSAHTNASYVYLYTGTEEIMRGYAGNVIFNAGFADRDFRIYSDTTDTTFWVDAANDVIGIGTTPNAGVKLYVYKTSTAATSQSGIQSLSIYSPPASTNTTLYGLNFGVLANGTGWNTNVTQGVGGYVKLNATSATGWGTLRAFNARSYTDGVSTANLSTLDLFGADLWDHSGSGTITLARGLYIPAFTKPGGTLTSYYGAYIEGHSNATTNNYGLYIGSVAGASNNFAIMTQGGNVRFNNAGADWDFEIRSLNDDQVFFVNGATDSIGMGAGAQSASKLYVYANNATLGPYTYGIRGRLDLAVAPAASSSAILSELFFNSHVPTANRSHAGFWSQPDFNTAFDTNAVATTVAGYWARHDINVPISNTGGGSISLIGYQYELYQQASNTGVIDTVTGALVSPISFKHGSATGTVTTAYGFRATYSNYASNLTTGYGIRLSNTFATSAQYGLYVDSMTGASSNFPIYTNSGTISFGDNLEFRQASSITTTSSTLTLSATTNVIVAPTGDVIHDPVANTVRPETNWDIDLGSITRKYKTLWVGEIRADALVAEDIISTIGGRVVVIHTTKLIAAVADTDTTIDVEHNQIRSGDRLLLMDRDSVTLLPKIEAMAATSNPTAITGGFRYNVTRNLDGTGANDWDEGDAVQNTGTTGTAWIEMYATSSMLGQQFEYIYVDDGGVFSANQWDNNNFEIFPTTAVANDAIYFGFESKADWENVFFNLGTAGSYTGVTFAYEYWDTVTGGGSWQAMTTTATPNFAATGYTSLEFDGTAQTDWGATTVNSQSAHWIRIRISAVSTWTTSPKQEGGRIQSNKSQYGPTIVGWERQSTTWNDFSEIWAIGRLDGLYGYVDEDISGVAFGEYGVGSWLTIDATNGIRAYRASGAQVLSIIPGGDITIGEVSANNANIFWDQSEGDLNFRGGTGGTQNFVTIESDGGITVAVDTGGTAPKTAAYHFTGTLSGGSNIWGVYGYEQSAGNIPTIAMRIGQDSGGAETTEEVWAVVSAKTETTHEANVYIQASSGLVGSTSSISLIADSDASPSSEMNVLAAVANFSNEVSIGLVGLSPDGTLHVHTASAGSVAAAAEGDDFIVEGATDVGMSFLSNNGAVQRILFGDVADNGIGSFYYDHGDNSATIHTNGADRFNVYSDDHFSHYIPFSHYTISDTSAIAQTGAQQYPYAATAGARAWTLERWAVLWRVDTTNDATHHWNIRLRKVNSSGTLVTIDNFDTSGSSANTWVRTERNISHSFLATDLGLVIEVQDDDTPGTLAIYSPSVVAK